jgi:hypothetical protein
VVIGSETSGGIRNVFIRNCRFNGTDRGLRFKTARGRGAVIENVWVRDITMGTIRKEAIIVNTLRYTDRYPAHPVSDRTPTYRNLHFQNITCENSRGTAIRIVGLPEKPMGGLTFENIAIRGGKGIHAQDAGNVKFTNVEVVPDNGPVVLLDECFDITIENANRPKDAHTFIQLIGEKTRNIKMDGADVTAAKIKVVSGKDVPSVATGTISAIRDGLWSDPSIWDADGDGTSDGRIPDGTKDLKVVIGGESLAPSGVTVILDKDVDDFFGVRVYDHSTLVIPTGRTLKLSGREGKFRPDRRNSLVRQTGGTIDISRYFRIDDEDCQYLITGGSVHIGGSEGLRFHEGELIIDDSSATITSISVAGPFRTDNGDGYKKTRFVAHSGGVTPIQCTDVMLDSYSGGALVVDVTDYDYATNGDLVLISYTGTRTGKFPASQVKVIGAKADLVYDDAAKKIKLSNFRP